MLQGVQKLYGNIREVTTLWNNLKVIILKIIAIIKKKTLSHCSNSYLPFKCMLCETWRDNQKKIHTCTWSTKSLLAAAVWWSPLLADGGTASGWSRSRNGTGTWNCGGESVWAREISRVRFGFTSYFIGDAVTAFVTFLPVPRVTGQLTTGLLLMKLKGPKKVTAGGIMHGIKDGDIHTKQQTTSHICAHTNLIPHACKVHGCSSQWRHTLIGPNWWVDPPTHCCPSLQFGHRFCGRREQKCGENENMKKRGAG